MTTKPPQGSSCVDREGRVYTEGQRFSPSCGRECTCRNGLPRKCSHFEIECLDQQPDPPTNPATNRPTNRPTDRPTNPPTNRNPRPAPKQISCGGHVSPTNTCGGCVAEAVAGHEARWCNGDCVWDTTTAACLQQKSCGVRQVNKIRSQSKLRGKSRV